MPTFVRDPKTLTKAALVEIVMELQAVMYLEHDDEENEVWDKDKEVNGGDLVETVAEIFKGAGLTPFFERGPRDWSPREKK